MATVSEDLGFYIKQHVPWARLPPPLKESLSNNHIAYERSIVDFSITNQLIWRSSMVRQIIKNEKKYYEDVLQHCRSQLLLYPYHLQDQFVQGLKVTPFEYYKSILEMIMIDQRSYDSLPNFTARDCFRLIGIGRNEYIDIMNKYRSKRFWKKRSPNEYLPVSPKEDISIDSYWLINVGYVTEEEIEKCSVEEHRLIDNIIASKKGLTAGTCDKEMIHRLYNRQLIYCVIPIDDDDYIVVPPLKGFVMNRVSGDYFETLLYKVFVTINEHTTVSELANVLQIDLQQVKNAVSVFIRLGFAYKKKQDNFDYDKSWTEVGGADVGVTKSVPVANIITINDEPTKMELNYKSFDLLMEDLLLDTKETESPISVIGRFGPGLDSVPFQKRIGFLFDSTLTAFLMMGNLSPGLKSHAVTMFEVGKLTNESLDDFLSELNKVGTDPDGGGAGEGEAQRYFQHAVTLRNTVHFIRHNKELMKDALGIDLLHCESMTKLDTGTLNRLLEKNYYALVSMAPLSQEVHSISCCVPSHIGPAIPEMNSIWFKLWLYDKLKCGPPSLLLTRGTRLRTLPKPFKNYRKLLLTSWGHDNAVVNTSNVLLTINEALTHSPILLQVYTWRNASEVKYIPFPFNRQDSVSTDDLIHHKSLILLEQCVDLKHGCGYVTLLNTGAPVNNSHSRNYNKVMKEAERKIEITEFLEDLKEIGIGTEAASNVSPPVMDPVTVTESDQMIQQDSDNDRQWVPLELCFGIPLFDPVTNESVCNKIVSNRLFAEDSLKQLTQSNRILALDLMDFITKHQDSNCYGHSATNNLSSSLSIPLPTKNLLFNDNVLTTFNN
ncbi:PREDICTED: protein FAM91A1-like [Amphimedon queenslandica]|uniref:Protein FAM91A1 n=1 Tax=Amphimedon queenslandica TaxID=400682 RepID=A0A1X7V1P1_AMPQE|nr:PREDICTED: protein FAM91A1-like [Amphimedon queenslandica]|eukprot:XP_019851083.1 PREDICTED: protein FAM91A1-like [Amphimedon queenslandica]